MRNPLGALINCGWLGGLLLLLVFAPLNSFACGANSLQLSASGDGYNNAPVSDKPVYGGTVPIKSLDSTAAAIIKKLQGSGNAYDTARKVVLANGWKPLVTKSCEEM